MPAFPATIGIPKSSYPLDLDQLESAASQFKSSTQNTVSIKQPQDSEEATEPALEVPASPDATHNLHGRIFHSLLPSATPAAAISSFPRGGVPSNALTESSLSENPEAANKETADNGPQPALRKASPRRNRDRFQSRSRMGLPYRQPRSLVNLVTRQETSSNMYPIPVNAPSHKLVQVYDRLINSYGRCPPPPHSDKGWIDRCLSEEYNEASAKLALLPMKGLGTGIGLLEYMFLLFGILICLAGIIHGIRYIMNHYVPSQRARQYQGRPLLSQIYKRKFSKSQPRKGISERWRNGGKKNGEVIWPEEEQEKVSLMSNYYPCNEDDEESIIYEKGVLDTESDYECRYGKPMGRVLLDGLVGSMKGGTWLRKVLGPGNSITNGRSWKEAVTVQSASIHTYYPSAGSPSTRQQQPFTNINAPSLVGEYSNTLGLSDSIRSASGVDMNWERGEVTLSFRRDALLRRAMRVEKRRMDDGDLGIHTRSVASSIRGAEANHTPARIHEA